MLPDVLHSTSSASGVVISLVGNTVISLALNLQKLAHQRHAHNKDDNPAKPPEPDERTALLVVSRKVSKAARKAATTRHKQIAQIAIVPANGEDVEAQSEPDKNDDSRPYLRSKLWWLGLLLLTLGEAGNFASYGFAPASVVAPLGSVALVSNCFLAPLILKERFRWSDLAGVALCIIGATIVVISSKQSDQKLDPDELLEAIARPAFLVYAFLSAACILLLSWLSRRDVGQRFVLIDLGLCALTGGFTVLAAKALAGFLQLMFLQSFAYVHTYLLAALLTGTAVVQINYLNKALARFDSRIVVPGQFVLFTISAIVGSAILYSEFSSVSFSKGLNFIFGCLTTFFGVYRLTRESDDDDEEEEESPVRSQKSSPLRVVVEEDGVQPSSAMPLSGTGKLRRLPSYSRSFSAGSNLLIASSPSRSSAPKDVHGSPSRSRA